MRQPRSRRPPQMPGRVASLFALLSLSLSAAPIGGQQTMSSSWRQEPGSVQLEEQEGALNLALDEALEIALSHNLALRVSRYRRAQVFEGIRQSLGIFDLDLTAISFAFDEVRPSASNLDGSLGQPRQFDATGLDLRLDQLSPWGGTGSLVFNNQRDESNNIFQQINPSFTIDLDLIYSQPLLRNLGRLATERNLRVARTNSAISLSELEDAVIGTLQEVENAYWSLVENRQQLRVAEESLALAKELHEMNRIQVEVGTLAPLELIQSEVGIATRQEEIIRAQAAVEDAEDVLRRLLNLEGGRYWAMDIVPSTDPEIARLDIDVEAAMAAALAGRPELQQQRLELDTLELDARFFRNQLRPRLDLEVRWGTNAVAGDQRILASGTDPLDPDPDFTVQPGGYGDAIEQAFEADFRGWQVGVSFGYPIQNRTARAQSTIADLALAQGKTRLEDLELTVRTDVRQAARAVETAAQQIDSARVSMRLAEENLDAERKRYENGLSTSFRVLEIQEDLTQARSRVVNAITNYRRAMVRYFRAIGGLLEEKGIELVDDPRGESATP